ncbi:MAG: response regulator [Candidatus Cyclobacteriaceae bacterium M3_2C_046]
MLPFLRNNQKFSAENKKRILLIEDDISIRMLLEIILKKQYQIVSAENGYEALCWLDNGNIPDLILTDLQMPKMDGYQFLKNIKRSGFHKDIPILMLSGDKDEELKEKCLESGADEFYVKPFNPTDLFEKIENLCRSKKRIKYA